MHKRYIDYTGYNIWANNLIINNLLAIDDELLFKEMVGSYPTIRATILHIWFAELGWLSRLNGNGWNASKATSFTGSNKELFKEWQNTSKEFKTFVVNSSLEKEIIFEHKEEKFSIPSRELVQTVCNHGSYHRGQIVMMLRQLGITQIAQTDYIEWVREKERGNI